MRKALLIVTVLAGLVAGAMPAQAGSLNWTDDKGDATQFLAANPVTPNEPALDITKVHVVSDAKKITWTITTDKMAEEGPSMNGGYFFRMNFGFDAGGFALRIKRDATEETMVFRSADDLVGFDLPCKDCTAKFDFKKSTLTIVTPIASLAEGIAAADDNAACPLCRAGLDPLPPFKSGVELTGLEAIAQRIYVRVTPNADNAPAPEGTALKV